MKMVYIIHGMFFFDCESTNQISKFLSKNKNFYLEKFITKKNDNDYNNLD